MKIAYAQLNPTVGALDENLSKMVDAAARAVDRGADLIVYPAGALTGLPLAGLADFVPFSVDAVDHIDAFAQRCPIPALVHAPAIIDEEFAESAGVELEDGYGAVAAVYLIAGGQANIAFIADGASGGMGLLESADGAGIGIACKTHFEVDQFEQGDAAILVEMCADDYASEFASPAATASLKRICSVANQCNAWTLYVNLCGAADSVVYGGGSCAVSPEGELVHTSGVAEEDLCVFELGEGPREQMSDALLDEEEYLWQGLVTATRDYFAKNGFGDALVGLSGGIDSAVVAAISADALGGDHVHGMLMPGPFSSEGSVTDALELAENLGIETVTVEIDGPLKSFEESLAQACGGSVEGVAHENLQARIRAVQLMTAANANHWLVLNTGNKSEAAMGFSTLGGDTCGVFAPIGDIYKTQVYKLAEWRAGKGASIPQSSIKKPPSAELYEGALDEHRLPRYDDLDAVLSSHVEGEMGRAQLVEKGIESELVDRVLSGVMRSEFKRRLEPMAPHVQGRALTAERSWPVTNAWKDK